MITWDKINDLAQCAEEFKLAGESMLILNLELLLHRQGSLKFILNDQGIVFFPTSQEHRDTKAPGMSYEDDYRGNAVAGIVTLERVEIRFHSAFSDERIRNLWTRVVSIPELAGARLGNVYYQGREL